ncbi:MAG: dUTP diphosphatase [Bacillota bacterium]|jgi:dUTP pyrophosphatase|nr:dUTP diphosphatase [Clostridia bacterium]
MVSVNVKIQYCAHYQGLPEPKYQTSGASGIDLLAAVKDEVTLEKGEYKLIPTGIKIEIPAGFEAQVRPRSGLALNYGISVLNTPGTIDSDYRGEIQVILINFGKEKFTVSRGMRIAQLVFGKIVRVDLEETDSLEKTGRDSGGFGHTGVR